MNKSTISNFITYLHKKYESRTIKRRLASLKTFYKYLEFEEIINENPFNKINTRFKEPKLLPRTVNEGNIQKLLYL